MLRASSIPAKAIIPEANAATTKISISRAFSLLQNYIKFQRKINVNPALEMISHGIHVRFFFFLKSLVFRFYLDGIKALSIHAHD